MPRFLLFSIENVKLLTQEIPIFIRTHVRNSFWKKS
jgi:hypothetical protein